MSDRRETLPEDDREARPEGDVAPAPAVAGRHVPVDADVDGDVDVDAGFDADADADADGDGDDDGDELPEDLQPALAAGPYVFPNNSRRRIPGVLYLAVSAVLVMVWITRSGSPVVNEGYLGAAVLLAAVGVYSLVAGRNLAVDERDALVAAAADVGFPVGHAAAQLGWRGWLSRPTWRILLYSAEDPPTTRGLIFVDGLDGRVIERIVEDNPEDWSVYRN